MENKNIKDISYKIRNVREELNMSQQRFGIKIGLSGKTISAYETGKCMPPLKVLEKISLVYDVDFLHIQEGKKKELKNKIEFIKRSIDEIEDIFSKSLSY